MRTDGLKIELIEWLARLEDRKIIESLVGFKNATAEKDWYDSLTAENKKAIKKGLEDHKNGNTLTEKEFWKKHDRKA